MLVTQSHILSSDTKYFEYLRNTCDMPAVHKCGGAVDRSCVSSNDADPPVAQAGRCESTTNQPAKAEKKLKTKICSHWKEGLPCPFDSMCTFAHGPSDMQPPRRHPSRSTAAQARTAAWRARVLARGADASNVFALAMPKICICAWWDPGVTLRCETSLPAPQLPSQRKGMRIFRHNPYGLGKCFD